MSNAISLHNVSKKFRLYHERNQYLKSALLRGGRSRYDEFWAVDDVTFEIPRGSTFGIIGSNGSGKSTLLKCLAGILVPDKGRIEINGRLSALLELGAGFHPELTGRENIELNGAILGMSRREIASRFDDIVEFSALERFIDTPVKNYSSGMVVRLGFSIAANVEPEILLIDEVLAVGDASFQQRCYEKIEQFRADGRTIVLVSHGLSQIEQICDTAAWMDKGVVREVGPSLKVVQTYESTTHDIRSGSFTNDDERWGTGEALITDVRLIGPPSDNGTFRSNSPMTVRIHYAADQPVEDVVFGIRITHLHGTTVWGSNTRRMGVDPFTLSGSGHVDLVIDRLPLLEGTFDVTVALSDHTEINVHDHREKLVRFDVEQSGTYDEGLVGFEARWVLNQQS